MVLLLFTNFAIFLGLSLLIRGYLGKGAEKDYIIIGSIWLLAVYSAIWIAGVPVGIPFINVYFFNN